MKIRRIVKLKRYQIISLKSIEFIIILLRDNYSLFNRDFLFKSEINKIYIYLINSNFNFVFIRNNNTSLFIIPRHYRIDSVIKYEIKEEYLIQIKNYFLIIKIT